MSDLLFPHLTQAENDRLGLLPGEMEDARAMAMIAIDRGDIMATRAAFALERRILDEQLWLVLRRRLSLV